MVTNSTPSPNIWAFLREMVSRFGAKNPAFFNVLSWIFGIATVLTGLPLLLDEIGVVLPDWAEALENKIVTVATMVAFVMANLGVQRPVFKNDSGDTVTLVDGDRSNLPFTDKVEAKLPAAEVPKNEINPK